MIRGYKILKFITKAQSQQITNAKTCSSARLQRDSCHAYAHINQ